MRFALLIPLRPQGHARANLPGPADGPVWTSRHISRAQILKHAWSDLPVPVHAGSPTAPGFTVETASMCRVGAHSVACLDVSIGESLGMVDPQGVAAMESRLTDLAVETLGGSGIDPAAILWVGRYALVDSADQIPAGWYSENAQQAVLPPDGPAGASRGDCVLTASWGNGSVAGWGMLSEDQRRQTLDGLVDAQIIWAELDRIGDDSALVTAELVSAQPSRMRRRELVTARRRIHTLANAALLHEVAFDESLMGFQGLRRTTTAAALEAWGYQTMAERVHARIGKLEDLAARLHERLEGRYQSLVEVVLFGLGLLTIVDIVLSVISTAYSGSVTAFPDEGSAGFFAAVRNSNMDLMMGGSAALILVTVLALTLRKGRK
ncbi:hypothetical protein GCM10023081_04980 [Arthrobacter ginkgonis]|uniref:DUF155 domain-containing protein n=1 Tax=Arthrobacter ginkgonis TaxID=1630594 RepID=A0ABP7BTI0_9MICC